MSWVEEQSWFGLEDLVIAEQEEYNIFLKKKLWRTSNGKTLRIKDMSTQHIRMCIYKILREDWRVEYLPLLKEELRKRTQ